MYEQVDMEENKNNGNKKKTCKLNYECRVLLQTNRYKKLRIVVERIISMLS